MSRYIDADLLLAQCRRNPLFEKAEEDKRMIYIERSIIDVTPTANVVEVVRCKDCKHYRKGECVYHSEPKEQRMYERWTVDVNEDDYCSCGERRCKMENLNAEAVKKAMECCQTPNADDCEKCEYRRRGNTDNFLIGCCNILVADALALINSQEQRIKELTEENERLKLDVEVCGAELSRYTENIVQMAKQDRADTVRKMQERLKAKAKNNEWNGTICGEDIDQIAKEMLEGENENT